MSPKYRPIIVLSFFLFACTASAIDIETAIRQKLIKVKAQGVVSSEYTAGGSSHYGACIKLVITNNGNSNIIVDLNSGQFFMPSDTDVQRMICTKSDHITLHAHQTVTKNVYAMCSQRSRHAPGDHISFTVRTKSTGNLAKIASFLSLKNYQSVAAQNAVWAVAEDDAAELSKEGNVVASELYNYVTRTLGVKVKRIPIKTNYVITYNTSTPLVYNITTTVSFKLTAGKPLSISVFDSNNNLVKNVISSEFQEAGAGAFVEEFTIPAHPEKKDEKFIFIRYYFDGKEMNEDYLKLPVKE